MLLSQIEKEKVEKLNWKSLKKVQQIWIKIRRRIFEVKKSIKRH